MFKKNDKIVYKGDVCIIQDIKKKYYKDIDYYILSPISDTSLTINIPANAENEDIREIISKKKALELINKIPSIDIINIENEKYIEALYKELLNNKTYDGLIKVIKTTYLRNQKRISNNKKISEKDDLYFKKAEQRLYDELSVALNLKVDDVRQKIINICKAK